MDLKDIVNIAPGGRGGYPPKAIVKDIEDLQRQLRTLRFRLIVDHDCRGVKDLDNADASMQRVKERFSR